MPEIVLRHQFVPGLGAEMRKVDQRRRIVGHHPQHRAVGELAEALARLQDRQRAKQPPRVELGLPGPRATASGAAAASPRQCETRRR
jgi:hypothetical protein